MKDKTLLNLLENYLLDETKDLENYIIKNSDKISKNDYKKLTLVLLKKRFFDYVNCNHYINVIENIDNEEFINDENNYI